MAKMFYTLDEAAEKLGTDVGAVRAMAKSGQIQEFRDRDTLMFKVDQIDLLSHHDDEHHDEADMSSMIPLASDEGDSFEGISLESGLDLSDASSESAASAASDEFSLAGSGAESGSALEVEPIEPDTKERTGVSIFDADELETADPSAVTQITDEGLGELQLDSLGSGSGLLDLTRESDDTSLGAEFLDELAGADEGTVDRDVPGGGLFDTGGEPSAADAGAPVLAVAAAEPVDPAGSGLAAGFSIGAILALLLGLVAVIIGLMGTPAGDFLTLIADNFMIVVASLAGAAPVLGVLGFLVGKKTG